MAARGVLLLFLIYFEYAFAFHFVFRLRLDLHELLAMVLVLELHLAVHLIVELRCLRLVSAPALQRQTRYLMISRLRLLTLRLRPALRFATLLLPAPSATPTLASLSQPEIIPTTEMTQPRQYSNLVRLITVPTTGPYRFSDQTVHS